MPFFSPGWEDEKAAAVPANWREERADNGWKQAHHTQHTSHAIWIRMARIGRRQVLALAHGRHAHAARRAWPAGRRPEKLEGQRDAGTRGARPAACWRVPGYLPALARRPNRGGSSLDHARPRRGWQPCRLQRMHGDVDTSWPRVLGSRRATTDLPTAVRRALLDRQVTQGTYPVAGCQAGQSGQ